LAAAGAAVLVFLALLSTGLPSTANQRGARAVRRNAARARPPSSSAVPTRSTLTAVNAIVDETGAGRERVISAIDAVQGCSIAPSDGQAAIGQVVSVRQQGLADLQRLNHLGPVTPADRSAIVSLTAVISDSIEADRAYMAWMTDIASGQSTCWANPMSDANFAAGQSFSAKADGDKQVFVQVWNPLAGRDGLSTYQPQDF
jgi:hypothetical protein